MWKCLCTKLKSHLKWVCVILADVSALDISSGTSTNSINANYFPTSDWIGEIRPRSRYPYNFPYFLYPSNHKIPLALASHRPDTYDLLNAQYNPDGTKMHFNRISNHTMHKFPQHDVSELNVSNRSDDAHEGRSQTPKEMRREFIEIGEERNSIALFFSSHTQTKHIYERMHLTWVITRRRNKCAKAQGRSKGLRGRRTAAATAPRKQKLSSFKLELRFATLRALNRAMISFHFTIMLYVVLWTFSILVVELPARHQTKGFSLLSSSTPKCFIYKRLEFLWFFSPLLHFVLIAAFVISYFMIHLTAEKKRNNKT